MHLLLEFTNVTAYTTEIKIHKVLVKMAVDADASIDIYHNEN